MNTNNKAVIQKDNASKTIKVTREFEAPKALVWKAWTESSILDQWWAPKPWKAETKGIDFKEGGYWLYAMVGPEGERHWARVDYETITNQQSFVAVDSFCDENGNKSADMPGGMRWNVAFTEADGVTQLVVDISFPSEKDMTTIVEMGFEEGFSAGLDNLEEWLSKQ